LPEARLASSLPEDVLQITQPNGSSIIEKVPSKNENAFETVVTSPKDYEGLEYKYSWLSEDRSNDRIQRGRRREGNVRPMQAVTML
jgi:hypothetical protein